jgi:serine/threonine-protein kinase
VVTVDARDEDDPSTRPVAPRATWVLADRYRLDEVIGAGGMGEVWGGLDTWLDRPVAVKLLARHREADVATSARFHHEARAMAALNDPHVVTVHDAGEHDGRQYIVMERLPGHSFADDLHRAPLPTSQVLAVARATLAGLRAAHEAGVLHRDVKPSNILFTSSGVVKLADFGVAKREGVDLTHAGDIMGTFAYLAPERLEGQVATPRSDLYAVGVIMYEALAGRRPFVGDTFELVHAIERGAPPTLRTFRPDLDPSMVAVVERAMHRDPDRRFGSAREVLDALEAVEVTEVDAPVAAALATVPEAGPTTEVVGVLDAATRRRSTLIAVGAGAVVAAIVALGLLGDGTDDAVGVATGGPTTVGEGTAATSPATLAGSDPAAPVDTALAGAPPASASGDTSAATQILQASPVPSTTAPATLDALVAVLTADPASAGSNGQELRDRLAGVLAESGKKRRDKARMLLSDVTAWSRDGRLTPAAAATATALLGPLANPDDERPGGD